MRESVINHDATPLLLCLLDETVQKTHLRILNELHAETPHTPLVYRHVLLRLLSGSHGLDVAGTIGTCLALAWEAVQSAHVAMQNVQQADGQSVVVPTVTFEPKGKDQDDGGANHV